MDMDPITDIDRHQTGQVSRVITIVYRPKALITFSFCPSFPPLSLKIGFTCPSDRTQLLSSDSDRILPSRDDDVAEIEDVVVEEEEED